MRPLVSAVIASRDRPELAARAVRSALAQTYEPVEIVLVDDGSTPRLVLPPELRHDSRVTTVRLDVPQGAGYARNVGVERSRGSLLAFLDDDDVWRPDKIRCQVDVLSRSKESVAAVECGFDLWDDDGLVLRFLPRPDRDLGRTLLERPCLQPSTVLLRRSAFDALGGFDPTLLRVEDWEFWLRLSDSFTTTSLPEVHVDRRAGDAPLPEVLHWYRQFVRMIAPRIEAQPPATRARIRAGHAMEESALLLELGERGEARSRIIQGWRLAPRSWRPPVYLARAVMGERLWSAGKRALRTGAYPLARALGKDPLVRSW